ncbi:MFS transporter permease [Halomonas alkaliantarctica]|nr:MFS transporter permease [Halomonas alkaliantarctica]
MSEWTSYRPGDLLMFSLRVYERLFVMHNQALWPAQFLALALGVAILYALLRPTAWRVRLAFAALALSWVFVAWAFLWQRYAPINLGIPYVVPFFVLHGLLLALWAIKGAFELQDRWSVSRIIGVGLFLYALVLHPLLALPFGRGLMGAEVFALTPDPLAIATLGTIAMLKPSRWRWALAVIPALWCLASGLTLYILDAPGTSVPLLAVVLFMVALAWPERKRSGEQRERQ